MSPVGCHLGNSKSPGGSRPRPCWVPSLPPAVLYSFPSNLTSLCYIFSHFPSAGQSSSCPCSGLICLDPSSLHGQVLHCLPGLCALVGLHLPASSAAFLLLVTPRAASAPLAPSASAPVLLPAQKCVSHSFALCTHSPMRSLLLRDSSYHLALTSPPPNLQPQRQPFP